MKDLKNLKGTKMLSKMEQMAIKGGIRPGGTTCGGVECLSMYNCCYDDACGIFDSGLGVCISIE